MRRLGRLPAVHDPRVAPLRAVLREDTPPDDSNWYAEIGDWPMLANNYLGDCVAAAALHAIQQRRAYALRPVTPTDDDAIALYSAWGGYVKDQPATDQGVIMSQALAAWAQNGVKLGAEMDILESYAAVEQLSLPWLKRAIWRTGSVMLGIQCPEAWLEDEVYLLDLPSGAPINSGGGHAILLVGYQANAGDLLFNCITWGQRLAMTAQALMRVADEAYAILDRDWCDAAGVDPAGVDWQTASAAMAAIRTA